MEIRIKQQTNLENTPLFTVIIPSKDRAQYLNYTLQTCMMQDYERLEVLVSDDGSTDNTRDIVEEASRRDSRIRYLSPGTGVGMRDNFEFVLNQVKPGFVIALGGDDGLLPGGIKAMQEVLQETGMDLLAWPPPVYAYPNVRGNNSQMSIHRSRNEIKIIDSHEFLCRQVKQLHYASDIESPMFYVKGVASTKLVEQVRRRSPEGRFYSCPTPDGYSGIVLAGEVSRYAFSGRPFSIYGLSPSSQGMAYVSNDREAKKASEDFFQKGSSKSMHRELAAQPYSPLITLMTADYLLTAGDLPGWEGRLPPIDFKQVLLKGLEELRHGLYGEERICRELTILNQIAEKHELGQYFRKKVRGTYRRKKRSPFEGSGINTTAIFFDGNIYNLNNIFEAANAAHYLYLAYCDINFISLINIMFRSLKYRLQSLGKGLSFPHESGWNGTNYTPE